MLKRLGKDFYEVDDSEQMDRLFRQLRKSKDIVRVGKVYVDVPWTVYRMTACGDGPCMADAIGKKRWEKHVKGKTCCTTYAVPLVKDDVERVARVVDEVRKIRDVDKAIRRADGWWKVEDNELWLEQRPSGACVFLSAKPGEAPLCTIHEWALEQGDNYRDHKPEACCLYPLYTAEYGDEILITSYGSPLMKILEPDQADLIERFACTWPEQGKGRSVLADQQGELEYRLGAGRWAKVLAKLRRLGHEI